MANHVLQKLGSMFTAAILCASCLPFGSVSLSLIHISEPTRPY